MEIEAKTSFGEQRTRPGDILIDELNNGKHTNVDVTVVCPTSISGRNKNNPLAEAEKKKDD